MARIGAKRSFRWVAGIVVLLGVCGLILSAIGGLVIRGSIQGASRSFGQSVLDWVALEQQSDRKVTYWCPMHPQIKRDRPGTCPICNMALVEIEGTPDSGPKSYLQLTAQQVQQAGVVTEPVRRLRLYREIDTTGRLEYDETRYAAITSWIRGDSRIDKLHINFTGQPVEQGELMAEMYSPELIQTQEEYLLELQAQEQRRQRSSEGGRDQLFPRDEKLLASIEQRLLYQGLTPVQIDRLATNREVLSRIPIYAPISGTVIRREVQEGQWVNEGQILFHVADLSHLWLMADVFESELYLVRKGQPVEVSVRSFPGEAFHGAVAFIDPMVQPETRTVRVRVEVPNPDGRLKPGMYARAQLRAETDEIAAVPADAAIWSGRRHVVIVRRGEGVFQPREVRIGRQWLYAADEPASRTDQLEFGAGQRRYHETLAGLHVGEEVVTAGAFLLNAESQFQDVLTKMLPAESESLTLEELFGEAVSQHLREMIAAYHALSETLARDEREPIPARAESLAEAAQTLAQQAEADAFTDLAAASHDVHHAAEALASPVPPDLDEARRRFGQISRAVVDLLSAHGGSVLLDNELFVFECPMAGPFGYKLWLGPSPEVRNPYMGQKMLECGERLASLEPSAAGEGTRAEGTERRAESPPAHRH